MLGSRLPHIAYGGDYNPDQWQEEVWAEDVRLMREAGVNLVSLGIFSWSRLQPREDAWDFGWLDRVMETLHEGGVRVDLATATASPPPWLSHAHPEMLPVLADGVRLWPGARQHYCPSSPVYRSASARLVEAIAMRYANHPALAMWHIGNEFGCHVAACWCDVSAEAFRKWLVDRYVTIEELNRAWGTDFWSQRYSKWVEILPPRRTPTWPNPTQQLDFMRFSSDELLECFVSEREILARLSPGIPITTNFMQFFKPLDYWKWAEREDIVSDDVYQDPLDPDAGMGAAMAADLMRSLGGGRPWILMEQTTSRVNWREINAAKAPGQMRLWSYQALARGADGVMFFQWRQSGAGAEKHHSAMVPHGPVETSPTWREVVRLGTELKGMDEVCDTRVPAEVAIVFDWDSWWALELPSKPSALLRALDQVRSYYRHVFDANVTADFAPSVRDLSSYKLVLVPNLYLVSDDAAANLNRYVSNGGNLVMSGFSGIADDREHVRLGGYPAPFREMLGLHVEDFLPLGPDQVIPVRFHDGSETTGRIWTELIDPGAAEVLATYGGGTLKGKPAVTRHRFGKGTAAYVSTVLDEKAMAVFLTSTWKLAGVASLADMPPGVETVRRQGGGRSFLFVLNHHDTETLVHPSQGVDLISGESVGPAGLRLPAYGVAIIASST
ncbi:MAG: beta-galactosidase [Candidatus Dormibacteraceae bacterium]